MRVLFLDVDGVLNAHGAELQMERGPRHLIFAMCHRLDRILRRSKATIVLSSAWRYAHRDEKGLRLFESWLFERGCPSADVIDRTPLGSEMGWTTAPIPGHEPAEWYPNEVRGLEIARWLETTQHRVDAFAIVDDSADMAHLGHRLVRTRSMVGLQDEHVDPLIALLLGAA